jgi:uncharacterized protein (DUF4213/DUF364 family)
MILDSLKDYLQDKAHDNEITDVRIGLCYTAVMLSNGNVGLAYTFRENLLPGCDVFKGSRPLAGKQVANILQYVTSADLLERTVGLATANALINVDRDEFTTGDVLDSLNLCQEDRVGMVGFFGPLVPSLKKVVKELIIFEKGSVKTQGMYSYEQTGTLLPTCTAAIITATSIINNTCDKLLKATKHCRHVVLLGATTPLAAEIFQSLGVTLLSGVVTKDPKTVLQIISEGGGMRSLMGAIKKVNLILPLKSKTNTNPVPFSRT